MLGAFLCIHGMSLLLWLSALSINTCHEKDMKINIYFCSDMACVLIQNLKILVICVVKSIVESDRTSHPVRYKSCKHIGDILFRRRNTLNMNITYKVLCFLCKNIA